MEMWAEKLYLRDGLYVCDDFVGAMKTVLGEVVMVQDKRPKRVTSADPSSFSGRVAPILPIISESNSFNRDDTYNACLLDRYGCCWKV